MSEIAEAYLRLKDELDTVNSAYNDLKKEQRISKEMLKTVRDMFKTSDHEAKKLLEENNTLKKSVRKMKGKNQKLGAKVMRLEKELRTTDSDKWNKYKEEVKNART